MAMLAPALVVDHSIRAIAGFYSAYSSPGAQIQFLEIQEIIFIEHAANIKDILVDNEGRAVDVVQLRVFDRFGFGKGKSGVYRAQGGEKLVVFEPASALRFCGFVVQDYCAEEFVPGFLVMGDYVFYGVLFYYRVVIQKPDQIRTQSGQGVLGGDVAGR